VLDAGIETLQLEKMIFTEKFVKDVSLISLQKVSKEVLSKIIAFIIFLIFLDFFSKELALSNLEQGQLNETFFPFIDFLLIYNSGIAFGILDDEGIFVSYALLILTLLISIYLVWLIYKEDNFKKRIALSFITGGALGNILDRINDGQVTDFLHLEIMNFSFFVFNLADLFITIGAILIIYFEIIYKIKDEQRDKTS
jgi:lipoprotein signal peptidase